MTDQDKIQQLELQTVTAVTEMRADIKNLTKTIEKLESTVVRMAENYVTKQEYNLKVKDLEIKVNDARRAGRIHAILWSILTAVFTSIVIFEVTKYFK